MKFTVKMKCPDSLDYAIMEAVASLKFADMDYDYIQDLREAATAEANSVCRQWFKYGELLTVEIDTDAKTCVVLPA